MKSYLRTAFKWLNLQVLAPSEWSGRYFEDNPYQCIFHVPCCDQICRGSECYSAFHSSQLETWLLGWNSGNVTAFLCVPVSTAVLMQAPGVQKEMARPSKGWTRKAACMYRSRFKLHNSPASGLTCCFGNQQMICCWLWWEQILGCCWPFQRNQEQSKIYMKGLPELIYKD